MSSIYLEPAGLIRRFIAFLIDGFVMLCIATLLMPFILYVFVMIPDKGFEDIFYNPIFIVISIAFSLLPFLYFTYFPSSFRQATLGQRFMNMYVIRLNQTKIGVGFALMRFLVFTFLPYIIVYIFTLITATFLSELTLEIISFVFFIVWYLMSFISDKNQTMYDMLLKTVVVNGRLEKAN